MTINSYYDSFHSNYDVQKIPKVDLDAVKKTQQDELHQQENLSGVQNSNATSVDYEASKASRIADLENVSLKFNKEDSFDYIGNDSSLDNLDMQKAISDMKKDQVLHGYQYFVGSARNVYDPQESEDGVVILKQ